MNIIKTVKKILTNNGGWIGAALGAAASGASNLLSAQQAEKAAKIQVEWERERAKHAHQWEVEDLKNAGLNPILSANGNGATTGGISAPVPDTSGIANAGQIAINALFKKQELENQTKKNDADTENVIADTELKENQSTLTTAQTATEMAKKGLISKQEASEVSKQALNYAQTNKIDAETKAIQAKLQSEVQQLQIEIELLKQQKKYNEAKQLEQEFNNKVRLLDFVTNKIEQGARVMQGTANSAANVVSAVNPLK